MKCIICEKDKDKLTEEHIFPDSIGGTLTQYNVCKTCNDLLGHNVDHHLVDHELIQFERHQLNIRGKSGKLPNPLEKGVIDNERQQKVLYRFDYEGKPKELYLVPSQDVKVNDDQSIDITISIDKKDKSKLPEMINKTLRRNGKKELTLEEIEALSVEFVDEKPIMKIQQKIDIHHYKRAILKIAYELAHYWIGEDYFKDSTGNMIKNCFLDNELPFEFYERYPIKGKIEIRNKENPIVQDLWPEEPHNHIAFMIKEGEQINCFIRIFSVFEAMIRISEHASNYPHFKENFISINPVSGDIRDSIY
ncbi:HNH endonuclease [Rummeliibacillus pycnus]|uniref:HNH endonuclease n=1 Tax=Rummeliibacillus pycnus TaxID=101070 RepID=UPI003D2E1CB8